MPQQHNKFEWLETKDLWRGARVQIDQLHRNTVTVTGSACIVANIEITPKNNIFYWQIYIEKMSNRCWIGILPGPISSIDWKIGECPPIRGIGIENTYGMIYKGTSKLKSFGRAPKHKEYVKFKLDLKTNTLYGSISKSEMENTKYKIFYKGDDMPNIACICVINSTGKGKFCLKPKNDHNLFN